jgi:DNA repair protein REV1
MMSHPLAPGSQSSDLYDSDPAFLQALEELEIPEEVDAGPSRPATVKRAHSPDNEQEYMNSNAYGASTFGGFGQYMARKRAKLQVQNSTLNESDASNIFRGLAIYVRFNFLGPTAFSFSKIDQWVHQAIRSRFT